MKRGMLTIALVVAVLLTLAPGALADGLIIPRPRPEEPVVPLRSLAIRYHHVTVTIDNQVATTHVDQVFVNESGRDIEGEYIFPLPESAVISQFAMWVDGKKLEAEVLDATQARRIYEEIVSQQRDPALLEYVGRNAFRARIYPIPARGEKRVEIEYSELLPRDAGLVRYVYPLNTEKFSVKPLEEVAVTVKIASKEPIKAVYSPSHEVSLHKEGEYRASVSYEETNVTPERDFALYYTVSEAEFGANLLSYKSGKEDGFFLLLLAPQTEAEDTAIVAKDVFFVLDTSGSMRGAKLTQARRAARYVLDNLNAQDRFNILAFSDATRAYATGLRPVSAVKEADAFLDELRAGGSTDIDRAFNEVLAQADKSRPQVIVFLTDGLPTQGETRIEKIIAHVREQAPQSARIFCFGVGDDVNTALLDEVAQEHHGTSSYVRPEEDIERAISSFYSKIARPVLADLALDFGGVTVEDAYPYPLPDLFAGSQLILVGRYRAGGTGTLTLHGTVNGAPQSYSFGKVTFREQGGEDFIPRLWATRKIGHLLTQVRLHGAEKEVVDAIVALSVRYGIITPYTSFLINETEDALSAEGREKIAARVMPQSAPQAQGLGGSSEKGAVAPAPTIAASGKAAVDAAAGQGALRDANVAEEQASAQIKTLGDKTFVLRDGIWSDTTFDAQTMKPERVVFGSERYFQLLGAYPEWRRYVSLGAEVVLVWEGKAYQVSAAGGEAQPQPGAMALPTPYPIPQATATPNLWQWIRTLLRGGR